MFAILHSLGMFVADLFKSRCRLEAENLFLRHQLNIALRQAPPRLRLYAPMLWRLRSFPDFIEPCLPSPVERPPAGADWIHEIKHDGFRLLARGRAKHARISLNSRPDLASGATHPSRVRRSHPVRKMAA